MSARPTSDDVLGHRRVGHQPHLRAGARQRRPRAGRHDGLRAAARSRRRAPSRPSALTMFGVTTPCVQAVTKALEERYDCLVFHATGTGGQSMEKLVEFGPARRRASTSPPPRSPTSSWAACSRPGPTRLGRDHPRARALCRLVRRARHGQLLGAWRRCRRSSAAATSTRTTTNVTLMRTTAEECGRDRPLHRRQAQPHGGPGAVPDPRGRRVGRSTRRASRSGIPPPTRRCSTPSPPISAPASNRKLIRAAAQHQRPGIRRRRLVAAFDDVVRQAAAGGLARRR